MTTQFRAASVLALCLALAACAPVHGDPQRPSPAPTARINGVAPPPLARIVWLEGRGDKPQEAGRLPVYRPIDPGDPRLKDYERWIDTEAGRFARRLVYRAARRFGVDPLFREPVLPVVIRDRGNNAEYGLAIARAEGVEEHPKLPYIILDPSPDFLGDTLLHESGHLVHSLAAGGRRGGSPWSAFPHTTFATSDPLTALAEGYGIHFETLWGHFGADSGKQAYYRRLTPSFEAGKGRNAHYFAQVADLMTFAQVWSRYQAVRDGLPAFEGHLYGAAYARTQMDPARDCAKLKSPNAMLASEGVAASVFFWISSAIAGEHGANAGAGFDQPGILDAEMTLLEALAILPATDTSAFRPDVLDVLEALKRGDAHLGDIAITRFVDVTHGVTARPSIRDEWRTLYNAAIMLDLPAAKGLIAKLDAERGAIVEQARRDIASLRAGVGPVLPVRVQEATFLLKAFGETVPVEFDLNAMSDAEMVLLKGLDTEARSRLEQERGRAPFASVADFTARTGLSLKRLGLVNAERRNSM